jgi:1-acyl-sn-glycerol-3-phosphate acyltransferase
MSTSTPPPLPLRFAPEAATIERALPVLERVVRWNRPTVRGWSHLPSTGPVLVVGNHSGGLYTPEAYGLFTALLRHERGRRPVCLLAHDLLFRLPGFGRLLHGLGGVPASPGAAAEALDAGAVVIVFPGGDFEAFRPFWQRRRVDFGGRHGYARLARERGVPIVPAVTYGSHESTFVLARGDRLARALGLARLRVKILPWVLGLPWGLVPGFIPVFPWPTRLTIELGPRIDPASAADAMALDTEVRATMQATLTRLAASERYPLFA